MAGDDAVCYLVVPGWLAAFGVMGSAANSVLVDRGALPQRQQVPERLWTNRDPSSRIARCIAWQPPEDPDRTPLEGANYDRKPLLSFRHRSRP
ncbi:MAG: hypothetical protein KGJ23_08365 [Euryarchaeota archaeon]|nr:hypothetical protein [Euryarchaeota archaeon]MDE2044586.1 hypothetical protein [Thermoplasmata archaeon]